MIFRRKRGLIATVTGSLVSLCSMRRRRLKRGVLVSVCAASFLIFRYSQMKPLTVPSTTEQLNNLKADKGKGIVATANNSLSYFLNLPSSHAAPSEQNFSVTIAEAVQGREPIVSILRKAGIIQMIPTEVLNLPKWQQVTDLYGDRPIVLGLERCKEFQRRVPHHSRYIGIAGNFNSGTTAFGLSLQANCGFFNRRQNRSNELVTDVHGMLNQVPWAKHKQASLKYNHTIQSAIIKDHVLPVVLVRDPYYWMQSMCKQGYGVRWDHSPRKHCPNLVPNDYDRRRFRRLKNASSVPVWQGSNLKNGPSWQSLAHFWNDWYELYLRENYPRLIIRFEDTLFHGEEVMEKVCNCAGGKQPKHFTYVIDNAKWDHKHAQNNLVSAIVKYGTDARRYDNMTSDDLRFAARHLNPELMKAFRYQEHSA